MDRKDYEEKAAKILQNNPFRPIAKNPTKGIERRLNSLLQPLCDRKSIDSALYYQLHVSVICSGPA